MERRDFRFKSVTKAINLAGGSSWVGQFMLDAGDIVESVDFAMAIFPIEAINDEAPIINLRVIADNNRTDIGLNATLPDATQLELVPTIRLAPDIQSYVNDFDPATGETTEVIANYKFADSIPVYLECDATTRDIYFQLTSGGQDGTLRGRLSLRIRHAG